MTGKSQAKLSANFSKGACGISEKKGARGDRLSFAPNLFGHSKKFGP